MFSWPKMVYSAGSTFCFLRGRKVAPDLLGLTHFRMSLWDLADMQSTCTRLCKFVQNGKLFYNCKLCDFSCTPAKSLKKHMMKNHTMKFDEESHYEVSEGEETHDHLLSYSQPDAVLCGRRIAQVSLVANCQIQKYTAATQIHCNDTTTQIHCKYANTLLIELLKSNQQKIANHWKHMLCLVSAVNKPFTLLFPFIQSRIKFPSRKIILWSLH